jgi:hypothetical protein
MAGDYELVHGARVDLCSTDGSADDDAAVANNDDAAVANNDDAAVANNDDAAVANNDDAAAAYNDDDAAAYNDDAAAAAYNDDDAAAAYNDDDDDAAAAYNGDDAYNDYYNANAYGNANNDGEVCPYDGVYRFSTKFAIPQLRNWMATGWSALGQVNMYKYDGDMIGTCNLKFSTTTTHRAASSKTVFACFITVISVALFVCVFTVVRRGGGFSRGDDARMFHRLREDVVKLADSMVRRKKPFKNDDSDASFDTRATLDTAYSRATTGTETGSTFSRAWFA